MSEFNKGILILTLRKKIMKNALRAGHSITHTPLLLVMGAEASGSLVSSKPAWSSKRVSSRPARTTQRYVSEEGRTGTHVQTQCRIFKDVTTFYF